jgi:hypothetical protein
MAPSSRCRRYRPVTRVSRCQAPALRAGRDGAGELFLSGIDAPDCFEAASAVGVEPDPGSRRPGVNQVHNGLEEAQKWFRLPDTAPDNHGVPGPAADCRLDLPKCRLIERHQNLLGQVASLADPLQAARQTTFNGLYINPRYRLRIKSNNQHMSDRHSHEA